MSDAGNYELHLEDENFRLLELLEVADKYTEALEKENERLKEENITLREITTEFGAWQSVQQELFNKFQRLKTTLCEHHIEPSILISFKDKLKQGMKNAN